ncbi:MAG: hypothetical protein FD181_2478 [Prolixibacteraceae bacterium]|nr:MAG: hypothetical protein FD181_2478 [Prolixibacteraceae bacterium]
MNFIIVGVLIFAFSIIVFSFIDLRLSITIYISYLILVPYLEFRVVGFPMSYNLVNTILFAVFLYQFTINKRIKLNFQFISPFLFLYFSLLYLSLFTREIPWSIQFNGWRASFMQTCLISFIIWNLALADRKFLIYFKQAFLLSITIAGIYGLFLMKMEGLNPYVSMITDYFGIEDISLRYSKLETRLDFSTARNIQSTMAHPMTWGLMLSFSTIIVFAIYLKTKNRKLLLLIALIGFNILISGVRTGIAAITIGFVYFLIRFRNIKLIILTLFALIAITVIVQYNENLSNLFASFTDFTGQKSDVSGSSITMRLNQLQGSLNEIKGDELVGKGYGWTVYYISLKGTHPIILNFESLIFMVLCNSGYIGLLVWIIFFLLLLLLNRKILALKTDIFLMDTFVIVFVAYATGTGEYGYMGFFALFYSFLLAYLLTYQQAEIRAKQKIVTRAEKRYIRFELFNKYICIR